MRLNILKFVLVLATGCAIVEAKKESSIMDVSVESIDGNSFKIGKYQGNVILVVNIATQCGYTPQLEGLEKLHKKLKPKGFTVLGVPSNDFGGQTPEDEAKVKFFCSTNYGTSFPLTKKLSVTGDKKHPLIKELIKSSSNKEEISWNFEKFLIGRDGKVIQRYKSAVSPDDASLVSAIELAVMSKN